MIRKKTLIIVAAVFIALFAITTTTLALDWGPLQKVGWGGDWDTYPNAAVDNNGKLFVVWSTYPYDRTIFFNSYDGNQWGTAQRISGSSYNNFSPDLFVDTLGNVHVVWEGTGYSMYYRKFNGSSWSSPTGTELVGGNPTVAVTVTGQIIIANTNTFQDITYIVGDGVAWSPRISIGEYGRPHLSVNNDGIVYLAYSDNVTNGKIAYRTWTGSAWSDENLLDGYCSYLKMFHGPNGTADILCLDNDINQWHYDGSTWTGPTLVVYRGGGWRNAFGAPNGVVLVAWAQGIPENDNKEDIFVRIWTGSKWLDIENVSNTEWRSIWPAIGMTSDNKVFTIWSENDYHGWAWTLKAREAQLALNDPPTVDPGGPYTVEEGSSVTLTATGADPEGQPLTYAWDLDNNATFETLGQSVSFADMDGPTDHIVAVQVTDNGGLSATASTSVHVNNLPPTVSTLVVSPEPSMEGNSITVSATLTDPAGSLDAPFTCIVNYGDGSGDLPGTISGDTCTGLEYTYPTFDIYTVTISVTDKDEGTGSNSATHSVIFNWTGFFQPVDNPPVLNGVKAGSAVPIKFSLGGEKGLNIFSSGYPQSKQVACDTGAAMDDIDAAETAGNSSLLYDPVTGIYNYVWKTEKAWVGTCRQLVVKLIDGTEHNTIFKFK